MAAVVAGTPEEVDEWVDLAIPEYEIYTSDDTSIKEVARGNPAVVFLRDGNVIWKRTLSSVDVEDFMAPDIDLDPMNYAPDGSHCSVAAYMALCGRNDFTCRYFADAKTVKPDRTKEPGSLWRKKAVCHSW